LIQLQCTTLYVNIRSQPIRNKRFVNRGMSQSHIFCTVVILRRRTFAPGHIFPKIIFDRKNQTNELSRKTFFNFNKSYFVIRKYKNTDVYSVPSLIVCFQESIIKYRVVTVWREVHCCTLAINYKISVNIIIQCKI